MSSHREAPEISKDPVADSTDVYAFVSPDRPRTVTLIANYIPLQGPAGGPNFYQFGDNVRYAIHIDTHGHGEANITYEFDFRTDLADPDTFLYNTGPITSLTSANWNRKQRYSVTRVDGKGRHVLGRGLLCPPCNIGPLSTPNYETALANRAIHTLSDGSKVFAGQRAEGFYVDLGSIFDLGNLRPFQNFNVFAKGLQRGTRSQCHQVPECALDRHPGADLPRDGGRAAGDRSLDDGVEAARPPAQCRRRTRRPRGPVPPGLAARQPAGQRGAHPDRQEGPLEHPAPGARQAVHALRRAPGAGRAASCAVPGRLPEPRSAQQGEDRPCRPRGDLAHRDTQGRRARVHQLHGPVQADMLRLNTSIPPNTSKPSIFGLLGGDAAGFPNGRRVFDDVVSIELRAIAGATFALIDPSYKVDAAAGQLTDGLTPADLGTPYLNHFPYLGVPFDGYHQPAH